MYDNGKRRRSCRVLSLCGASIFSQIQSVSFQGILFGDSANVNGTEQIQEDFLIFVRFFFSSATIFTFMYEGEEENELFWEIRTSNRHSLH